MEAPCETKQSNDINSKIQNAEQNIQQMSNKKTLIKIL